VQCQCLLERRWKRHNAILAAFPLVDADLAAIEVDVIRFTGIRGWRPSLPPKYVV
jgi:hypothetical protein